MAPSVVVGIRLNRVALRRLDVLAGRVGKIMETPRANRSQVARMSIRRGLAVMEKRFPAYAEQVGPWVQPFQFIGRAAEQLTIRPDPAQLGTIGDLERWISDNARQPPNRSLVMRMALLMGLDVLEREFPARR